MPDAAQSLHRRIRGAILALDLAPGERLSERGLEPEFRASRTPIRAALLKLESEGLVCRDDRGWRVTPIDLDDVRGLYEFREILETASARLATERATRDELAALATRAASTSPDETPEHSLDSGTSFHVELARLSGNNHLIDVMENVLTRLYRTRWIEVQSADSRDRVHREHTAIADALLAGDEAAAEVATVSHLRGTGERLIASLGESRQRLRATGINLG